MEYNMESKSLVIDKKWDDISKHIYDYKSTIMLLQKIESDFVDGVVSILLKTINNPNHEFINALNAVNDMYNGVVVYKNWEVFYSHNSMSNLVLLCNKCPDNSAKYIEVLHKIAGKIPPSHRVGISYYKMNKYKQVNISIMKLI